MEDRTTSVVKEILGRLGIEAVDSYDAVSGAVDAELARRRLDARVTGIRWGCVTIGAARRDVNQVEWLKDVLTEVARRSSGGTVASVRIRVADRPAGVRTTDTERKQ
jgi:hypothetical protein